MDQRTHVDLAHLLDERDEDDETGPRRFASDPAERENNAALIFPQNLDDVHENEEGEE